MSSDYNPFDSLHRLQVESDPFRILALGTEAALLLSIQSSHNAAEAVITTHAACTRQDHSALASQWLTGLAATAMWRRLITHDFFVDWLQRIDHSFLIEAQSTAETEAFRKWRETATSVRISFNSEAELRKYCEQHFGKLQDWERADGSRVGFGGYNALVAANRSRWASSENQTFYLGNPAAFGFAFALDDDQLPATCLQKQLVTNTSLHLHSVTLGTSNKEDDNVLG